MERAPARGRDIDLGDDRPSDLARSQAQAPSGPLVKFSKDPQLIEKAIDVVGLDLDPPKGALVLCVDETVRLEALSDSSGVRDPGAGPPQRPGGS